jgi:thiol-disulfide isomerase/thioredoxin
MSSAKVTEINDSNFATVVASKPRAIVKFYATWCGHCKGIAPLYTSLADKYTKVLFLQIDVDNNAESTQLLRVNGMPTFVVYINGKHEPKYDIIGADTEALKNLAEKLNNEK